MPRRSRHVLTPVVDSRLTLRDKPPIVPTTEQSQPEQPEQPKQPKQPKQPERPQRTPQVPIDKSDLLSCTQLQMMYVVESQRGSPALFVLDGWFLNDNARWMEATARHHPSLKADFRTNEYHELPDLDGLLLEYNAELIERKSRGNCDWVNAVRTEGAKRGWSSPSKLCWSLVVVDRHALILWAGPHRVVTQSGSTTHLYLHPMVREDVTADKTSQVVARAFRRAIGTQPDRSDLLFALHDDTLNKDPRTIKLDILSAQRLVERLRRSSWAVMHMPRDATVDNMFSASYSSCGATSSPDSSQPHATSKTSYERSPFDCPLGTLRCCVACAPTIQAVWTVLYRSIPTTHPHVYFKPMPHIHHEDDNSSPFFPPHIDYDACASESLSHIS